MEKEKPENVDSYILGFPAEVQKVLQQVRSTVRDTAPEAEESISYGMPAYKFKGKPLVYFAAFKNHIGFTPRLPVILLSKKRSPAIGKAKGLCNFRWTSLCHCSSLPILSSSVYLKTFKIIPL